MIGIGANRFGNEFELEPKSHSISFVALVSRKLFDRDQVLRQLVVVEAQPIYRDALLEPSSASEVAGPTVTDRFVLESTPALGVDENNETEEISCPGAQTLIFAETEDGLETGSPREEVTPLAERAVN